jgi:hypothetical protein
METGLKIEIAFGNEDVLELEVSASNGVFSGRTRPYASVGSLEDAATQLSGFPNAATDTRLLVLGGFGHEYAGGAVSLAFAQSERAGHGYVQVVIEAEDEVNGITETVTLAVPFELSALDAFVVDLRHLDSEQKGIALLKAAI